MAINEDDDAVSFSSSNQFPIESREIHMAIQPKETDLQNSHEIEKTGKEEEKDEDSGIDQILGNKKKWSPSPTQKKSLKSTGLLHEKEGMSNSIQKDRVSDSKELLTQTSLAIDAHKPERDHRQLNDRLASTSSDYIQLLESETTRKSTTIEDKKEQGNQISDNEEKDVEEEEEEDYNDEIEEIYCRVCHGEERVHVACVRMATVARGRTREEEEEEPYVCGRSRLAWHSVARTWHCRPRRCPRCSHRSPSGIRRPLACSTCRSRPRPFRTSASCAHRPAPSPHTRSPSP